MLGCRASGPGRLEPRGLLWIRPQGRSVGEEKAQGWGKLGVGNGVGDKAGTGTGAGLRAVVMSPLSRLRPLPSPSYEPDTLPLLPWPCPME